MYDLSSISTLLAELKNLPSLNFQRFSVVYCPGDCNKAAHGCNRPVDADLIIDGAPDIVHVLVTSELAVSMRELEAQPCEPMKAQL